MLSVCPPRNSNISLEISPKMLENPLKEGQPAAKPLREDSDYLIFNDGRLFSKKSNKFLSGKIDNVGYRTYALAIKNPLTSKSGKMVYAHHLVAEYFIPNPCGYEYVHHKDENKLNNNVDNLEWASPKQNTQEHIKKNPKCRKGIKAIYKIEDLPEEEWKVVIENPTYSVSNYGRVINNTNNRLLKIDTTQKYRRISFNDRKHYYLHRLVYCTFTGDYDLEGYVIDHINNNPDDNRLENLQKITVSENNYKRFRK